MQLVTNALGHHSAGSTMVRLAMDEAGCTSLQPRTVSAVEGILQQLSQDEEQVLRMRYGIDMPIYSAHQISESLGVLPHQVERLALRAFRKLRDTAAVGEILEGPAKRRNPPRASDDNPGVPEEPSQLPNDPPDDGNPWDEV